MNLRSCITLCLLMCGGTGWSNAALVLSDSCDVTGGGNSPGTGFGPSSGTAGINYQINARVFGTAAAGVSYRSAGAGKADSSYSITSNKVHVALAAGAGRYSFTTNGTSHLDLGAALGIGSATASNPATYELGVKISNQSPGTERTSFGVATADGGIQAWAFGIQILRNGANLEIHRRVDGTCNPSGTDYNNLIASLAGEGNAAVDLRLRITDAGGESGGDYSSKYEVFANNVLVFASTEGDFRFANSDTRMVLFDTAPNAGPVTYDAFSLNTVTITNTPPPPTNQPLAQVSA